MLLAKLGGAERARTADIRLAKAALSQLSYSPDKSGTWVGLARFELATSRLSGVRSNQLSYRPKAVFWRYQHGVDAKYLAHPKSESIVENEIEEELNEWSSCF